MTIDLCDTTDPESDVFIKQELMKDGFIWSSKVDSLASRENFKNIRVTEVIDRSLSGGIVSDDESGMLKILEAKLILNLKWAKEHV